MRLLTAPLVCLALAGLAPAGARAAAPAADPYLLELYQDLHRHPELSFQEVRTAARLAA